MFKTTLTSKLFLKKIAGILNQLNSASASDLLNGHGASGSLEDLKSTQRRSQNMTECVPVPSSEHVAEIVGRQGKNLYFLLLLLLE